VPVDCLATVEQSDGSSVTARVKNLPEAGLLIETPLAIGDVVSIQLPSIGSAHAQVRWSLGNRSGLMFIEFNEAMPAALPTALQRARVAAETSISAIGLSSVKCRPMSGRVRIPVPMRSTKYAITTV